MVGGGRPFHSAVGIGSQLTAPFITEEELEETEPIMEGDEEEEEEEEEETRMRVMPAVDSVCTSLGCATSVTTRSSPGNCWSCYCCCLFYLCFNIGTWCISVRS